MSSLAQISSHATAIGAQFDHYENHARAEAARNGPLKEDIYQAAICQTIAEHRRALTQRLESLPADEIPVLAGMAEIYQAGDRMRGTLYDYVLPPDEQNQVARCREVFLKNWITHDCFTAFVALSFYAQPFELPLQKKIEHLPVPQLERYFAYLMRQPHLMNEQDEDRYLIFYKQLTDWLLELIVASDRWDAARRNVLLQPIKQRLTFGACYYLDRPVIEIVKNRARLIEAIVRRDPNSATVAGFPPNALPVAGREKLRLGIYSRNMADYTDTRALFALFHAFDPARYEIYWYTLDIIDPSALANADFERSLKNFAHKIIPLRGAASAMAKTILADDLDIFVIGAGYSFSVKDIDQMLFHRLGRVQLALSELTSGSSGLPGTDYFFVPDATPDIMQIYRAESTEQLKIMQGPVLWYEKQAKTEPTPALSRAALGIPADAVLYCSGAAANKQMAGTLGAWMQILEQTPNSYLLLYPFNPAWGGYFIGLTFLARLRAVLKQFPGIDPARIVVVRQVSPQDGNRLIRLCDIYLGSFPRGGATSAMLALRHGKPVVARREKWLHSHDDAIMLRCLGLDELIAPTTEALVELGVRLGTDTAWRQALTQRIERDVETAPFFDIARYSREFQKQFDAIAREKNLRT